MLEADNKINFKEKGKVKKKWLLLGVVVAVALIALLIGLTKGRAETTGLTLANTTVLAFSDIQDTINATGTVESASSMTVYSTLANTVKAVHVEVGDYVEAGALLAELDGDPITDQIESQEAALGVSQKASTEQIKAALDNYNSAKYALQNGLNASIISAENQVQITYDNYLQAQKNYERYKDSLDNDENTALLSAEAALDTAKMNLKSARNTYDLAEEAYQVAEQNLLLKLDELGPNDFPSDPWSPEEAAEVAALEAALRTAANQLTSAELALDYAEDSYDTTRAQYQAALTGADDTLVDLATAMDGAYKSYQTALKNLAAAQEAAQTQLQSYLNALNSAKAAGDNTVSQVSLRQLRADLASTRITAPISGTVTAVYAKVGASGGGLLFVIEDVKNLIIKTAVKEYDIATVKPGMAVAIKSDATGDAVFDGVVTSIAPTSTKNQFGQTDTAGDALFATEVTVTSPDTGLKIGMSVRLDYIVAQQNDVLTVPYEAIYKNAAGQSCVMTAHLQDDGKYLLGELPVKTGIGNDLYIAIDGHGVKEGLRVINEPQDYLPLLGKSVSISEQQPQQKSRLTAMGGF